MHSLAAKCCVCVLVRDGCVYCACMSVYTHAHAHIEKHRCTRLTNCQCHTRRYIHVNPPPSRSLPHHYSYTHCDTHTCTHMHTQLILVGPRHTVSHLEICTPRNMYVHVYVHTHSHTQTQTMNTHTHTQTVHERSMCSGRQQLIRKVHVCVCDTVCACVRSGRAPLVFACMCVCACVCHSECMI